MDVQIDQTVALVLVAAVAYGKFLGPVQTQISQWFIDLFAVPSHARGVTNLATGLILALCLTLIAVIDTGQWSLLIVGALAGTYASVEAAKEHDRAKTEPTPAQ